MQLNFLNGSDLQKSACRTVAHNLLNFPFDAIPLTVTVEFVSDPLPSEHNEFAATTWSYGSSSSRMKIAAVAPNWPYPFNGVRFLQEVFAHELGHSLFAALPSGSRIEIAQMFGARSDDIGELNGAARWEDRYMEGIAETFKDAFLPQRFRVYPNRTNRKLSISQYPAFRGVWRDGSASIVGGDDLTMSEKLRELRVPFTDNFLDPAEEIPLSDGGAWDQLAMADSIGGCTAAGVDGWKAHVVTGNESNTGGALRNDVLLDGSGFGCAAMIRALGRTFNQADQYWEVYVAASNAGGGQGYRLRIYREPGGGTFDFKVALQYISGGSVQETLREVRISLNHLWFALTLIDGELGAWYNASDTGRWNELFTANHSALTTGLGGIGGYRHCAISAFTAGQLPHFGGPGGVPIDLSEPSLVPLGFSAGSLRKRSRVSGGRG